MLKILLPGKRICNRGRVCYLHVFIDHSPSSSAEVKECVELYHHSSDTPSWRGA